MALDADGDALRYGIASYPAHGDLTIDPSRGTFTYSPEPDYFGEDSFQFTASDGRAVSAPTTVSVTVVNTYDAPTLAAIASQTNSPETRDVRVALAVGNPDRVPLKLTAVPSDPSIADVRVDTEGHAVVVRTLREGATDIRVTVDDGATPVTQSFDFSAAEVEKAVNLAVESVDVARIRIRNEADQFVDFVLTHNGFPTFENLQDVVDYVRAMPERFAGETFERKLWRFVRDWTYHNVPLSERRWLHSPAVTLNSLGWGFCSHAASAFVEIARTAGYEARIWSLDGHVVPEIRVAGQWRMLDPDLAVYYFNDRGVVANVEDLAYDRSLVAAPRTPIFDPSTNSWPYSDVVADIYSSPDDNRIADATFIADEPFLSGRIRLPPGVAFVYPGVWTEPPVGVDGEAPYEIRYFRQAAIEIETGWTGVLQMPLVLWDVQGSGSVSIDGIGYEVGSEALRRRIRETSSPLAEITIDDSRGLRFVFFINAVTAGLEASNEIRLRGLDVWALTATVESDTDASLRSSALSEPPRRARPDVLLYQ